jgi:drug/metabolite transporter (DMT)-like permease
MIPACVATVLWSFCVVAARRSIAQLGENAANFWRLLLAVSVLGFVAHTLGLGITPMAFGFFFLSGIIGFGFGDIGAFYAIPRIGSRLTILMAQCLAAPIAGLTEWLWLGTVLSLMQVLAIGAILAGVVIALAPRRDEIPHERRPRFLAGIAFGLLAGAGQGIGAVMSRQAYAVGEASGEIVMAGRGVWESILVGATAGYQRLLGGFLIVALFWLASRYYRPWRSYPEADKANVSLSQKSLWVSLNALSGPIVGIIFFQWALATTPSAIVQPIVALTPVVIIPFTYWLEGERPSFRSVLGGLVGVAGVIWLASLS